MVRYKLDKEQLKTLASITAGIGHALFAASVVPFILGLAHPPLLMVILTLLESILCWILAILFSRKEKRKRDNRSK